MGLWVAPAYAYVKYYTSADGLSHDRVRGFYQDSDGMMWICTWYGIDRFDGYKFYSFRPQKELDVYGRFKQVCIENDTMFIKTIDGKSLSFDLNNYKFDRIDSFPETKNRLTRDFVDRDGNRWTATDFGIRFTSRAPTNYFLISNKDFPYARAIYENSEGKILISWCSESNKDITGEVLSYALDGNQTGVICKDKPVYSILEDNRKNIWLGTRTNGISILTPQGNGRYKEVNYSASSDLSGLSNNFIYDLLQDQLGRVWIATLGGGVNIVMENYDIKALSFLHPKGYPDSHSRVRNFLIHNGVLYIGTDNGLLQTNIEEGKKFQQFKSVVFKGSQPADEIINLADGWGETILISSFGKGIYSLDPRNNVSRLLVADDIADKHLVYSAITEGYKRLWVTARTALMLYNLEGEKESYVSPVAEKLTYLETKPLKDSKGRYWFATTEGVLCVNSPDMAPVNNSNKINFTDITFHRADSTFTRILTNNDSIITVPNDLRNLSLGLSSMLFSNPDGVRYEWRIQGKDSLWTETDGQHSLTLTNLPSGYMTIEVKSTDEFGRALLNQQKLTLFVTPHWYEHPWIKVVVGMIAGLVILYMIWLIFHYRRLYDALVNSQPVALISSAVTEIKPEETITEDDRKFIDDLNCKIEATITNSDFSIDSIVAAMGMSRSVFYRRLKSIVGQSPSEYINEFRLNRAISILRANPTKQVAEIAYDCGFSSPQYFSNVFRKRYHMTPNEWRKNNI